MKTTMSIAELDLRLHNAVIDLDTLEYQGEALRAAGYVEGSLGYRAARFRFQLEVEDVSGYDLRDEARIGQFFIEGFYETPFGFEVLSPLPMSLRVTTSARMCELTVDEAPFEIRRLFRWRPAAVERSTRR